jgi:hypothetical protein
MGDDDDRTVPALGDPDRLGADAKTTVLPTPGAAPVERRTCREREGEGGACTHQERTQEHGKVVVVVGRGGGEYRQRRQTQQRKAKSPIKPMVNSDRMSVHTSPGSKLRAHVRVRAPA